MKLVLFEPKRQQDVHIEQESHGKFFIISATRRLVSFSVAPLTLSRGSPVAGSSTMHTDAGRSLLRVRIILSFSTATKSGSPGVSPSCSRTASGRATSPCAERFVVMSLKLSLPPARASRLRREGGMKKVLARPPFSRIHTDQSVCELAPSATQPKPGSGSLKRRAGSCWRAGSARPAWMRFAGPRA